MVPRRRVAGCDTVNWSVVISYESTTPATDTEAELACRRRAGSSCGRARGRGCPDHRGAGPGRRADAGGPRPRPPRSEDAEPEPVAAEVLDTDDSVRLYLREIGRVPAADRGGGGHPRQGHGAGRHRSTPSRGRRSSAPRVDAPRHRAHDPREGPQYALPFAAPRRHRIVEAALRSDDAHGPPRDRARRSASPTRSRRLETDTLKELPRARRRTCARSTTSGSTPTSFLDLLDWIGASSAGRTPRSAATPRCATCALGP